MGAGWSPESIASSATVSSTMIEVPAFAASATTVARSRSSISAPVGLWKSGTR